MGRSGMLCAMVLVLGSVAAACKDKADGSTQTTGAAGEMKFKGPGNDMIYKMAQDDLVEAKQKLQKGEDIDLSCVAAMSYVEKLHEEPDPQVKKGVADLEQFCSLEGPVQEVEAKLKKLDEKKKAEPKYKPDLDCVAPQLALETAEKAHKDDPKVKATREHYAKTCPP